MEHYTIGKLSKATGLTPDTLRHYDAYVKHKTNLCELSKAPA